MFTSLDEKLRLVEAMPGLSRRFPRKRFLDAMEEARDTGLIAAFEEECCSRRLLELVVTPYLSSFVETFVYALNLYPEVFDANFRHAFRGIGGDRLRLLEGISCPVDCIKIEAIDLGAHWNPPKEVSPMRVRSADSAHVQVLFAGIECPDWVRQMDPYEKGPSLSWRSMNPATCVPYVFLGGVLHWVTGRKDQWGDIPFLRYGQHSGRVSVCAAERDGAFSGFAVPEVWRPSVARSA
jgi:hypothetical protein